ncbi:hypothetical protein QYE76_007642, partial [Lolium multiflorum]
KMTYGVFMAATKLKHYFEEHPMKVVSEAPISDIMCNKDASGRIAKWAIQISPYVPEFLINGTLPVDENESRRIQRRSKAYTIINGEVYKRSVTGVLQRCVEPEEGKEMLEEIHQGECGHHASSRALVAKVFRHGFYWPTALENAEDL